MLRGSPALGRGSQETQFPGYMISGPWLSFTLHRPQILAALSLTVVISLGWRQNLNAVIFKSSYAANIILLPSV